MTARAPETDTVPSPLRAAKRAAGALELEVIRAAQVGERGVRAGRGPTDAEVAELEAALAFARATAERLGLAWAHRLAPTAPVCLACVRAAAAGGDGCAEHREGASR